MPAASAGAALALEARRAAASAATSQRSAVFPPRARAAPAPRAALSPRPPRGYDPAALDRESRATGRTSKEQRAHRGPSQEAGRGARARRHPLRRGLRRRHAADRHQVHGVHRARRQRPLDLPRLPGRDPRPRRLARRRLGLPDPLRLAGHPHARRPARRAGRLQPGRAAREHRRPAPERHADREHRRLRREEHRARRLRRGDPLAAAARALPRGRGADHAASRARRCATRSSARARPTAARTSSRSGWSTGSTAGPIESTHRVDAGALQGRRAAKRTCASLKAGIHFGETTELFPVSFFVPKAKIEPGVYRNITGNTALAWGIVAAGVQMDRPVFLGRLPDHAGERRAARARALPPLRREDLPGRGRDRRRVGGDRRVLRGPPRHLHHERARASS